jgi:polyisoprenoid-binding protein YceI
MSTATQTEPRTPAGTFTVDATHSSATFEVEHAGVSIFRGAFKPIDAKLVVGEDGIELEGAANVDAIDIDDENIRPHLLSPEFFDAERNPEIRFRSTEVSGSPDDLKVVGELSMAGATLPVEATGRMRGPVALPGGAGEKVSVSLETTIDRTAFGMDWQMELPSGGPVLANDVRLVVELEFNKE